MSGAELAAATGGQPIALEGIENAAHYRAGREAVLGFLNSENQGLIFDLRELLEELRGRVDSPALRALDAPRKNFRDGKLALLKYGRFLLDQARQVGLPGEGYPALARYAAGADSGFEGVQADAVFADLEALDARLRGALYENPEQGELDRFSARLDIMEKMLNISATPEEVAQFQARPGDFRVAAFASFLQRQGGAEAGPEPEVSALDAALDRACARTANRRPCSSPAATTRLICSSNCRLAGYPMSP
jgi:hypothetical protein